MAAAAASAFPLLMIVVSLWSTLVLISSWDYPGSLRPSVNDDQIEQSDESMSLIDLS